MHPVTPTDDSANVVDLADARLRRASRASQQRHPAGRARHERQLRIEEFLRQLSDPTSWSYR